MTTHSELGHTKVGVIAALKRRPIAIMGAVIILFLAICALWPTGWLPHDPTFGNQNDRFLRPVFLGGEWLHVFGTDQLGRDVLSMIIAGSRSTLLIVTLAATIGLLVGVIAGLCAGYFGGWVDAVIMRLTDIQLAFPAIVLVIAIVAAYGPSIPNLIVILGIIGWAPYARLVRGSVISIRRKEYIEAAEIIGVGRWAVMFRHILPNIVTTIIVFLTFDLATLVLLESSLSFLGLGVQPPDPSWGLMVAEGRQYIYEAWWVAAFPGIMIILAVMAFNFFGDEIRDALDPRTEAGRA